MSKVKRIVSNVYVFSVISKIIVVIVGFVYAFLLARYLGAELKGQLTYINTITSISVIVLSLGIHQAYPYYKKQKTPNIKNIYVHSTLLLCIFYALISLGLFFIFKDYEKISIAILLSPLLTYTKLITYLVMVENPNKKNRWEIIVEVFEVCFLIVLYIFAPRHLVFCILMIIIKNIIAIVYYFYNAHEDLKVNKTDFRMLKSFIGFGILPMFSLLMNSLNYRIDVLMLNAKVSDAQIGIYSVGISLAEKIWLLSDALRDVLYSKLTTGKDAEEVNKVVRISLTICAILSIGLVLLGKPFIFLCYGEEYIDAYYPLIIVLFGTMVMVYYKVIQTYNIVHHKQKTNFTILLISVILNVILNYFFIDKWGINGAAGASLISYTVCALLFVIDYVKTTHSKIRDLLIIKKSDLKFLRSRVSDKAKKEEKK